jgi:hypothetical protein
MRVTVIGLALVGLAGCGATPPVEPPPTRPSPTEQPLPGGPAGQAVMRFRPAWLPERFVEVKRWVNPDKGDQVRDFHPPAHLQQGPRVSFKVSTTGATFYPTIDEVGTPVDVNGVAGRMIAQPDPSYGEAHVEWSPEPGVRIAVNVDRVPDEAEMALRTARSVVADSSPMFGGDPIRVGWLPGARSLGTLTIEGRSPADWSAEQWAGDLTLSIGDRCYLEKDVTEVRVRSVTGWYFHDPAAKAPRNRLYIPLEGERCFAVSGRRNQDELIRVADSAQLQPTDTAWLGTR